jgi:hypothetical protein
MNIAMNNMWKKMFLKYLIFCINSFNTITININVIRLYDYFIIGGLFVRGAFVLFPFTPENTTTCTGYMEIEKLKG